MHGDTEIRVARTASIAHAKILAVSSAPRIWMPASAASSERVGTNPSERIFGREGRVGKDTGRSALMQWLRSAKLVGESPTFDNVSSNSFESTPLALATETASDSAVTSRTATMCLRSF